MYWTPENMNPFYVKERMNHKYEKPFGWSVRKLLRAIFIIICAINIVSLLFHIDFRSPKRPPNDVPQSSHITATNDESSKHCSTDTAKPAPEMNFQMKLEADIERMQQAPIDNVYAYPRTNIQAYSIASLLQMIGFAMNVVIRLRGLLAIGAFKGCDEPTPPSFGDHTNHRSFTHRESFSGCIVFIGGMILLLGSNSIGLFKVTLFDLLCHCLLTGLGIIFLIFAIDDNRSVNCKDELSSVPWRSTPDLSNCSLPTLPADDDLQQASVSLSIWPEPVAPLPPLPLTSNSV